MKQALYALIPCAVLLDVASLRADPLSDIPHVRAVSTQERFMNVAPAMSRSVVIRGKSETTVVQDQIRLADIADVSSRIASDDETVIGLKQIVIADSPMPGGESKLSAEQVLETLRAHRVDLDRVGYLFPRSISVTRAARTINVQEVSNAIVAFLKSTNREADVKNVIMSETVRVSPRATDLEVVPLATTRPGHQGFQLSVREGSRVVRTFDVQAAIDEWAELPVARRNVQRGELIEGDDIRMARVNLSALPRDTATKLDSIIGQRAERSIAEGEVFHSQELAAPPLVQAGQRVTLMYRSRSLEATATGFALESGSLGQVVRLKNEVSKKVLSGVVTASGIIEVKQ